MKVLIVAALLALAACASTPGGEADSQQEGSQRDVAFRCDNGESLSVRFFPATGVAVLTRHGTSIELPQQPSGSGFIYSNGPNTLRGKGSDLTVEIGRMVPLQCKAL